MTCPNAQQLAAYFDNVLTEQQYKDIALHVKNCSSCQQVLALYEGEEQFLAQSLATPTLPDSFNEIVLQQLTPYKRKKRWQKPFIAAASVLLAGSIAFATTPTFATLIQSIFAQQGDTGILVALENGAIQPVNLKATSGKRTVLIEDVLVDTSRIGFTYRIVKENGKLAEPYFELDERNTFRITDESGQEIEKHGLTWSRVDEDFGLFVFDLPPTFTGNTVYIDLHLEKLGFHSGQWDVQIPFDLTEARKSLIQLPIEHTEQTEQVEVMIHEMRHTKSATTLTFSNRYIESYGAQLEALRKPLINKYGASYRTWEPEIIFTIENANGEVVAASDFSSSNEISSTSEPTPYGRQTTFMMAPLNEAETYTFVWEGTMQSMPTEKTIPLKEHETLAIEGGYMEIEEIDFVRESGQKVLQLHITGEVTEDQLPFTEWRFVVEDKGFDTFLSGGAPFNEETKKYELDYTMRIYGLKKQPELATLVLTEYTYYEALESPIRIPLVAQ